MTRGSGKLRLARNILLGVAGLLVLALVGMILAFALDFRYGWITWNGADAEHRNLQGWDDHCL